MPSEVGIRSVLFLFLGGCGGPTSGGRRSRGSGSYRVKTPALLTDGLFAGGGASLRAGVGESLRALLQETDIFSLALRKVTEIFGQCRQFGRIRMLTDLHQFSVRHGQWMPVRGEGFKIQKGSRTKGPGDLFALSAHAPECPGGVRRGCISDWAVRQPVRSARHPTGCCISLRQRKHGWTGEVAAGNEGPSPATNVLAHAQLPPSGARRVRDTMRP